MSNNNGYFTGSTTTNNTTSGIVTAPLQSQTYSGPLSAVGQWSYGALPVPGTTYRIDVGDTWPWEESGDLVKEDAAFIKDFKTRHPDFDTYHEEISLILSRQPGLKNTILFLPLLYQLAVEIRKRIHDVFSEEKVEKVIDGQTP